MRRWFPTFGETLAAAFVVGVGVFVWLRGLGESSGGVDFIEYRGERIMLSRVYFDYDTYQDDPDNIHPTETERAQRLVRDAVVADEYPTRRDAMAAVSNLRFPGYGFGTFGQNPQNLDMYMIEIPRAQEFRYFVFRSEEAKWRLVDDFLAAEDLGITSVSEENGQLIFRAIAGKQVLVRPVRKRKAAP